MNTNSKFSIVRASECLYRRYPSGQLVRITPKGMNSTRLDAELSKLNVKAVKMSCINPVATTKSYKIK